MKLPRLKIKCIGVFENKFGIYNMQAIVRNPDGNTELSADEGFDFTINSE